MPITYMIELREIPDERISRKSQWKATVRHEYSRALLFEIIGYTREEVLNSACEWCNYEAQPAETIRYTVEGIVFTG